MSNIKKISLLMFAFIVSCGDKNAKLPDDAVKAMERARAAEADIYAPQEYMVADNLFKQMQNAMIDGQSKSDKEKVVELAKKVIDAANNAIDVARKNKATTLIAKLKQSLAIAQQLGLDEQNPSVYNQANQSLIDAESYYSQPDYEKAIEIAQNGLDLLNPLIGGSEALALANLNKARELLDRAYKTTDRSQVEDQLTQASNMIEQATIQYQSKNYIESIANSQAAIDLLNDLITNYPGDGAISIVVDDEENLQVQAYNLIRQLSQTIKYIRDNNFTNAVSTTGQNPIAPQELTITNSSEIDFKMTDDDNQDIEILLYEEEPLSYLPVYFRAQSMDADVITVELIESYHTTAQQYYDQGNYLNAIDQAREGMRLAELYLAGQMLTTHTVIRGDTLWDISKGIYKTPWLWPNIWRANKLQIKDPDLIYPKQKFRIPPAPQAK